MRFNQLFSRLHRDEAGTSLTELTITLPVFILSFVSILHLHGIQDLAIQGYAKSYRSSLEDFKSIQSDWIPFDWSVNPITAGTESGFYHNSTSSGRDLAADLTLDPVPIAGGHMTESWSRLLLAGAPSDTATTVEIEPAKLHRTVDSVVLEIPKKEFGTNITFTTALMSDRAGLPNLGVRKQWMSIANEFLGTAGARPAIAGGMRYGVTTKGIYDESGSFMGRSWPIQTYSHLPAPTRPTSKWVSLAVIRMYLTEDEAYDNDILAFEMDLNTSSDPAAAEANDCASSLDGLSINASTVVDMGDILGDIESGNPCGSAVGGGGANPFSFFTNVLGNAAGFFGSSSVPSNTSSGQVPGSKAPF